MSRRYRIYQNSRPAKYIPRLARGNAIPVVAISPRGNAHVYPSVTEFVRDVESLSLSQRRTANRRVASGGGFVGNWYVTELRGFRG